MSILSILLGFALLCTAALAVLHALGVFAFPSEYLSAPPASDSAVSPQFPVFTKPTEKAEIFSPDEVPDALFTAIPFIDQYYIKLEVHSDMEDGTFAKGVYEIWKYGDRYRLHRYHPVTKEVEYTVICNGNRVQITDFSQTSVTYAVYSEAYTLEEIAPLPNFKRLFAAKHHFLSYIDHGETVSFSCEYPVLKITDRAELSKTTGLISSYTRLYGDGELLSVNILTAYDTYVFIDDMFSFD